MFASHVKNLGIQATRKAETKANMLSQRVTIALLAAAGAASALSVEVKKVPRTQMEPDVSVFEAPRWARGERVKGDEPVTLTFFLKHCPYQFAKFHADLEDRSDPASPNYGKWLDVEGVSAGVEKPTSASPRYRAGVASMAWRSTRRFLHRSRRASSPPPRPSSP